MLNDPSMIYPNLVKSQISVEIGSVLGGMRITWVTTVPGVPTTLLSSCGHEGAQGMGSSCPLCSP